MKRSFYSNLIGTQRSDVFLKIIGVDEISLDLNMAFVI